MELKYFVYTGNSFRMNKNSREANGLPSRRYDVLM